MAMECYCGNQKQHAQYIDYLKKCINSENKSKISCPYFDPDGTYRKEKYPDCVFYEKIVTFLQKREAETIKELDIWQYVLKSTPDGTEPPLGIHASCGEESLYLRSDLFGFRAPQQDDKTWHNARYPYAKYLNETNDEDRFRLVADWIWTTRTIGGSFIWPLQKLGNQWLSRYNLTRGIGCKRYGWGYIQDRVDLTLFEVKHYYECNSEKKHGTSFVQDSYKWKDDKMFAELIRNPNMQIWLNHFGSFETFVDFFMFDDFVCKVEAEKLVPKNIENGEALTEEYVTGIKSQGGVIQNLTAGDVKAMLNNVSNWTLARSKKIEELLETEKKIKSHH